MTTRAPGEHRDPLVGAARPISVDRRPEAGPIAVLPKPSRAIVEAIEAAGGTVAELSEHTRGVVWLVPTSTPEFLDLLRAHPAIGWLQLPFAGVEGFADAFAEFGSDSRLWTSAKGLYAEPVAEHALALTVALMRGLPEKSRSSSWARTREGISLYGRKVVIVGAGGVALEIVRLLEPFETSITVVRRSPGDIPGVERTIGTSELSSVLPDADVLILAAAATSETASLIAAAELASMKPSAVLVNIARGALVDSLALADALNAGHLAGAGLDVTDPEPLPDGHPLWSAPRCVITSHAADTPDMVEPLLADRVRHNVRALLGDGAFVGIVDPAAGY
jgi:phosphoglycerate dehydrogenase-like enzyme